MILLYYYSITRKFSPPTGGFFLAPAEGLGPSGPKVILPDGLTDGLMDGLTGLRELDLIIGGLIISGPEISTKQTSL